MLVVFYKKNCVLKYNRFSSHIFISFAKILFLKDDVLRHGNIFYLEIIILKCFQLVFITMQYILARSKRQLWLLLFFGNKNKWIVPKSEEERKFKLIIIEYMFKCKPYIDFDRRIINKKISDVDNFCWEGC